MGAGYTRQAQDNIIDGAVIDSDDLNAEFNELEAAFNATTGHTHDGTEGEGPQLTEASFADGAITTAKLDDDAVTTAKLADDAVTTVKIADDAVTGTKIDSTTTVTAASFIGPLTGNVTGNVTGDVTGNVTGDLTGNADTATAVDGVTASASELNILNGATLSTSELNILDGVTATASELNYLDITTLGTTEASKAVTANSSGVVTFENGVIEETTTVVNSGGTLTLDLNTGNNFYLILSQNVSSVVVSNPPPTGKASFFTLEILLGSASTINWGSSFEWAGGTAPELSSGAGDVDILVFYTRGGGTYYGFVSGQDMN